MSYVPYVVNSEDLVYASYVPCVVDPDGSDLRALRVLRGGLRTDLIYVPYVSYVVDYGRI